LIDLLSAFACVSRNSRNVGKNCLVAVLVPPGDVWDFSLFSGHNYEPPDG